MSAIASQITRVLIACSAVCSGADQINIETPRHWPLCGELTGEFPAQKGSVMRKILPFDDVIMTKIAIPDLWSVLKTGDPASAGTVMSISCASLIFTGPFYPRQNGGHFAHANFKFIWYNERFYASIQISLMLVDAAIDNKPTLVQVKAWRQTNDKPLLELMLTRLTGDASETMS